VTINRRASIDLIADASMFSKTKYYPATISTCSPSNILFMHKNELLKLFSVDQNILYNFLESVSNRTLALNYKIEILSLNYIQERIAHFLIREYENNNNSSVITLPFSKKTLAEHLNVSRPSLSRELKQLEAEGLISFNKQSIKIRDLEGLKKLLY
jgi:CRP-like cAMP-binding protein